MTIEILPLVAFILFLASLLQGAVGFALSLFATPLLVWAGVSLSQAVALVSVSILTQVVVATYQFRAYVHWPDVWLATLIRYTTIPIGIALLIMVNSFDLIRVKQLLGLLLLLIVALQWTRGVEPPRQTHPGWRLLAFSFSGVMQGLAAMGGPPAVMWVLAQRWSSHQTRAFLFSLFLLAAPLQILLLYVSFGRDILGALLGGFAFTPVIWAGSSLGIRLGNLMTRDSLHQLAFSLLLIIAITSILAPWFG